VYSTFVDFDEFKAEGDHMVGDDIAEEGIAFLKAINFTNRPGLTVQGVAAE